MKDKISLAGDLGSGKSTVSKILIEKLGMEYYSTGSIVRSIAAEMDMPIAEFNKYMETHPEIDHRIDDGLVALSELDKSLVIDSRMAWHFTKGTFKVYLSTDVETSALRIMYANRAGEHSATLEDTVRDTLARRKSEQKRYMEQYGVDIKDLSNYSLVVDTSYATPDEVAEVIIESLAAWREDGDIKLCFISPERLHYTDDEPDADKLAEYTSALECGEGIPTPTVFECEGKFYVDEGVEAVLAYSFDMRTLVPVKLVRGTPEGKSYVQMKNSL